MTCSAGGILRLMRLLWLPAAALLAACGAVSVTHDLRITIDDPSGRLGAPPWSVNISSASGGQTTFGSASPASPFRETFHEVRGVHGLTARSNEQRFNFRMPALAAGWWHAIVLVSDGTAEGYARLSGDGGPPDADAEVLFLRGTAIPHPDANGWRLDLQMRIPDAPRKRPIGASPPWRASGGGAPPGSCSFGIDGQLTVRMPDDVRVLVLTKGDADYEAVVQPRMEAVLRSGGCVIVDRTDLDTALRSQLERSVTSASALQRMSRRVGATRVLLAEQATGIIQLVEVPTGDVMGTWSIPE